MSANTQTTHKTFFLTHPRDYYDKLVWENERLKEIPSGEDREQAFQIMNCVTTAWHLSDWVYEFMNDKQRAARAIGRKGLSGYQNWLKTECGALRVCRQLATASKHSHVTKFDDNTIGTDHLTMVAHGDPSKRFKATPLITVRGAVWFPDIIMRMAEDFWRTELKAVGLFIDPSPWGRVDRNVRK